MAKVISIDKDVSNYNGDSWKLADYPSFAETDNAEEWLGVDSISLIRAKELAFELGGDEAYDIEDEINSATDLDELQDALSELKYFQRDNTYNSSWWGGVVDFGVLTEDGEGYGKGLVLLRMHGGGDPRGNYYDMKAFELDSFIEDFPPYFARLTYYIKTDEGDLVLDTDDMEGYTLNVVSDETGTYEEDDYVKIDEIEDAFDMDGNSFYGFGGGVAIGGLLGAYLGYKIGRARPQKKGFSTEKRVGRNIKSAFTKKKYDGGGDVKGVVWDRDSDSIRTQLGEFVVLIYPQSQKGYYDVYVSAYNKKVGVRNDVYGLDKAKDVAYEIIGNANSEYKGGGGVSEGYAIIQGDGLRKDAFSKIEVFKTIEKALFKMSHIPRFKNLSKEEKLKLIVPHSANKQYKGGGGVNNLKVDGDDFSSLLKLSDKDLVKRLDLVRKQQLINGKQYLDAKNKNYSTTKIEESGNRLAKQERAIIEARLRTNKFAQGGDVPMNVGIGSTIVFMSANGDKREGEIISKLDENSWEVSHSYGVAMVKNDEIIEVTQKSGRKKLFGIFDGGGDVDSMSEEDAKRELEQLEQKRHIATRLSKDGGLQMVITRTDNSWVSSFYAPYDSYRDALKSYMRMNNRNNRYDNGGDVRGFSWYQDFKPKGNNSMLTTNEKIHNLMSSFGFKVDDIQPNDSSVGIFDGWVMFFDDKGDFREISYNDIIYLLGKMDVSKSDIINESSIYNDDDEYARGGNVNTGRSWHLDRARHNKRENYEIPMNSRKKRFDNGGGVNSMEDYNNRLYAMSNDELAREYARVYTDESRRDVLQNLNEESYLYKPMYLYYLQLHNKVESRKNKYGQGGGIMNRQYLSSLPQDKKMIILNNIAKHYGVFVEDIENEVTDDDAEHLYEYIANDNSLRMNVYNDFQRMSNRYAKGGMTEHGLRDGDTIIGENGYQKDEVYILDKNKKAHIVNLDKGERFGKGGNIDDLVKG